ncbi:MAG TPA: hypothetical protein VKV32_12850 [Stellaceae bacterium]|nr:hypothetical protein [Stellaceae bacterium]
MASTRLPKASSVSSADTDLLSASELASAHRRNYEQGQRSKAALRKLKDELAAQGLTLDETAGMSPQEIEALAKAKKARAAAT